jgi:hypothetical protein
VRANNESYRIKIFEKKWTNRSDSVKFSGH